MSKYKFTNSETRVRCTSAVSYRTRDFFMIAKEIKVTVDNVTEVLGFRLS